MKQLFTTFLLLFIIVGSVFSQGWRKNEMEVKIELSKENHSQELFDL